MCATPMTALAFRAHVARIAVEFALTFGANVE